MNIYEILILALALALDAMIVSFSYGLIINKEKIKNSIMLASAFGFFQFIMPVIGWHLSSIVYNQLQFISKWIVFIIFIYLAIKFIKSAFSNEEKIEIDCISISCLLGLAIATSIDALGAGISIRFSNLSIIKPSILIGIITFACSVLGFWTAALFKKLPTKYIEFFGAILFIYLAVSAII